VQDSRRVEMSGIGERSAMTPDLGNGPSRPSKPLGGSERSRHKPMRELVDSVKQKPRGVSELRDPGALAV